MKCTYSVACRKAFAVLSALAVCLLLAVPATSQRALPLSPPPLAGLPNGYATRNVSIFTPGRHGAPARPAVRSASFGNVPLSFEENRGQAGRSVKFLARGAGYSLALTPTEAVFALRQSATQSTGKHAAGMSATSLPRRAVQSMLHMQLAGANRYATVSSQSRLPGIVSYFLGKDPKNWHTGIPTFKQVRYAGVYPGIDLVYYGNQRQLEYDFVVAPKADPSRITIRFSGAHKLTLDKGGNLLIGLKGGSLQLKRPIVYQKVDGTRKHVLGRYVLCGAGRIGFSIAKYDKERTLVIDPVLLYSTFLSGGSGLLDDSGTSICVDGSGSAYVSGITEFWGGPGGYSHRFATVWKLDPTGSAFLYETSIGSFVNGGADTVGNAIAVDNIGSVYLVGTTSTADFPTVNAFQSSPHKIINGVAPAAFLTRLSPAGRSLLYSSFLGGNTDPNAAIYDTATGVAVGRAGIACITGYTSSTQFPTVRPKQPDNGGGIDAFVSEFDTNSSGGNSLLFSTYLGGAGEDEACGIAADGSGNFYVTGYTQSTDFPTLNAFQPTLTQSTFAGAQNAFVAAFSPTGGLFYSSYLGGSGTDIAYAIAVDGSSNVYITGLTTSRDFPLRNGYDNTFASTRAAFVARINCATSADASLVWSSYALNGGRGIALDRWGNVYVAGGASVAGGAAVSVTIINPEGNRVLFFGGIPSGSYGAHIGGIAVDFSHNAYLTGNTISRDFPLTPNAPLTRLKSELGISVLQTPFALKFPTFTRLDLNRDGQPDLLFQNSNDGSLVYWFMNADQAVGINYLTPAQPGLEWKVVGSADLNGDNTTDLLFQNTYNGDLAFWLMDDTTAVGINYILPANPGADWKVVGLADFDHDGYTDILFQNSVTGDLYVWYMVGTEMLRGDYLSPRTPAAGWKVVAVGDLNGDGQADLLFQHTETGDLYVLYMNGPTAVAGGYLNPANPGAGWKVVGLADVNGDGKLEILFQNVNTGYLAYWVMDGRNLVNYAIPQPFEPGAEWTVVGLH